MKRVTEFLFDVLYKFDTDCHCEIIDINRGTLYTGELYNCNINYNYYLKYVQNYKLDLTKNEDGLTVPLIAIYIY